MSNKLYIPEIGDELQLTKDWSFDLYNERRNASLWKQVTGNDFVWSYREKMGSVKVTLPIGTILAVDRIYIRKGASEFSSISFRMVSHPEWKKEKSSFGSKFVHRFWAKLADCNTIEFEQVKDATKEIKITKWDYYLRDVAKNGHYKYIPLFSTERPSSYHMEGFGYIKNEKVIKMVIDYDIDWVHSEGTRNIFGMRDNGHWQPKVKNIKYTIYSLEGVLVGEYKAFSTAKTNAKKYLETK